MLKIDVYVIYTYTTTYIAASFLSFAVLLNKSFLNKQPKNVVSLQKKSGISAKYSSKLDILHSICISFAEEKRHLSNLKVL